MKSQSLLKTLFSSELRIGILSHFFFHPGETIHVRGLASFLGEPAGTVARELAKLEKGGFLCSHAVGNQKHYSLDEDNAILEDLRNIFLKVSGAGFALKGDLEGMFGVEIAFIFGSYAEGRADASSDLDLMIVGDADEKVLAPIIAAIEGRLARPINYVLYPRDEVATRLGRKGDFVHEVFSGRRLLLIGNENDPLLKAS